MVRKLCLIAIVVACISGCRGQIFSADNPLAPKPFGMGGPPDTAPQDYKDGWKDGCDTGLSTMVTGYYKSFYAYKQDPYRMNNAMYYKAWKDSYTYCRQYSFRFIWNPYDRTYNKAQENPLCVLCPNELGRAQ